MSCYPVISIHTLPPFSLPQQICFRCTVSGEQLKLYTGRGSKTQLPWGRFGVYLYRYLQLDLCHPYETTSTIILYFYWEKAPPDFGLENERTHCSQNTLSEPYHKMVNSIRSVFPARIKCRLLWFNFLHVRLIFANETVSHASIISILEPSINDVA